MIQLRLSQEIQEEFNPILWTFSKITELWTTQGTMLTIVVFS